MIKLLLLFLALGLVVVGLAAWAFFRVGRRAARGLARGPLASHAASLLRASGGARRLGRSGGKGGALRFARDAARLLAAARRR